MYVATTRAKNHLYIVGEGQEKDLQIFSAEDVFNKKTYLDLILSGLKNRDNLSGFELNYIDEIQKETLQEKKNVAIKSKYEKEINSYLKFNYPYLAATKLRYKNSVTGLNAENKIDNNFVGGSENLDIGNAYADKFQQQTLDSFIAVCERVHIRIKYGRRLRLARPATGNLYRGIHIRRMRDQRERIL